MKQCDCDVYDMYHEYCKKNELEECDESLFQFYSDPSNGFVPCTIENIETYMTKYGISDLVDNDYIDNNYEYDSFCIDYYNSDSLDFDWSSIGLNGIDSGEIIEFAYMYGHSRSCSDETLDLSNIIASFFDDNDYITEYVDWYCEDFDTNERFDGSRFMWVGVGYTDGYFTID